MREIKFRCWNKHNRKECAMLSWEKLLSDMYTFKFATQDKEESHILMQFTGLKDKNEKEIYEGDILKTNFGDYEVIFGKGCAFGVLVERETGFGEYPHEIEERFYELNTENDAFFGVDNDCKSFHVIEVIGNIYENPELTEHDALQKDNEVKG